MNAWELWREAMLRSEGKGLIELHRNYLGDVAMPYRKHDVIRAMEAYVRRAETRETIDSLLDGEDRKVAAALAVAGPQGLKELENLLGYADIPRAREELLDRLANLTDRLVAYPLAAVPERWAIAPWMDPPPGAEELFECSFDLVPEAAISPYCDDLSLFACVAVVLREPRAFKRDLKPGAKGAALLQTLAPETMAVCPDGIARATRIAEGLKAAGALSLGDRNPVVDPVMLVDIAKAFSGGHGGTKSYRLSGAGDRPGSRMLLSFFASAYLYDCWAAPGEPPRRGEAAKTPESPIDHARTIDAFFGIIARTLGICELLARDAPGNRPGSGLAGVMHLSERGLAAIVRVAAGSGGDEGALRLVEGKGAHRVANAIAAFGLVTRLHSDKGLDRSKTYVVLPCAAADALAEDSAEAAAPASAARADCRIDGSGTIILSSSVAVEDLAFLVGYTTLAGRDTAWTFRLGREDVARAFQAGIRAEAIVGLCERLSGMALPQSVSFMVGEWEKEYRSVRLFQGVVVVVAQERRQAFATLAATFGEAMERLSEGVWLVREQTALGGLADSGFISQETARGDYRFESEGGLSWFMLAAAAAAAKECARAALPAQAPYRAQARPPSDLARFERIAEALEALELAPPLKRELQDRLRRRLVISTAQLATMRVSVEGGEARGLDFMAKVRLIERAIDSGGTLELALSSRENGTTGGTLFARPLALYRQEGEMMLRAAAEGSYEEILLSVGSLAAIRRVRMAIFGAK